MLEFLDEPGDDEPETEDTFGEDLQEEYAVDDSPISYLDPTLALIAVNLKNAEIISVAEARELLGFNAGNESD